MMVCLRQPCTSLTSRSCHSKYGAQHQVHTNCQMIDGILIYCKSYAGGLLEHLPLPTLTTSSLFGSCTRRHFVVCDELGTVIVFFHSGKLSRGDAKASVESKRDQEDEKCEGNLQGISPVSDFICWNITWTTMPNAI